LLAAVQRPLSLNCITIPVGRPLWKDIPSWFLVADDDRLIVPATQRYMAERMKAKIKAHAVDHTPIVTAPGAVVDTKPQYFPVKPISSRSSTPNQAPAR
jgi:pimeloyl-ACP methyl ester carboxylesterase